MGERKSVRLQLVRSCGLLCVALAGVLPASAPAHAFQPTPTPAEVKAAIDEGAKQAAAADHGFMVNEYVLFGRPDPLRLEKQDHPVDAVIVGTPREQFLYLSYLNAVQRKPTPETQAEAEAKRLANTIRFRVFAHAPSGLDQDRDFIKKFSPAELRLDNGKTLTANVSDIFGPGQDFFITGNSAHAQRWLGAFSYPFDLNELARSGTDISTLKGTLSFADGTGYRYSFPVDLAKYE
ncbi:MAG TPA: hypothetical protein VGO70_04680 [Arsenicitalea sp.]|jgi:hypothetical protein|nr:hypothetical protein [Arsenicitalea sp.]